MGKEWGIVVNVRVASLIIMRIISERTYLYNDCMCVIVNQLTDEDKKLRGINEALQTQSVNTSQVKSAQITCTYVTIEQKFTRNRQR